MPLRGIRPLLVTFLVAAFFCIFLYFPDAGLSLAYQSPQRSINDRQRIQDIVSQYPTLSDEDRRVFLELKQKEYDKRRQKIREFCNQSDFSLGTNIQQDKIVYDEEDGLAYCMIPKVASSTWCTHFINLGNPPERLRQRYREALQLLAPKLFPAPEDVNVLLAGWEKLTSLVVVRHPLSRLASIYQQKFVNLADHKAWGKLNARIIQKFRKKGTVVDGEADIPSPDEMVRYVASTLESGRGVDQHWKPQVASCPFCALNFSIYARVEEMAEDTLAFVMEANLEDRLNISTRMNPTSHDEYRFWSSVSNWTISSLLQPYRLDFQLFGYSAMDYLTQMNIPYDPELIVL